MNEFDQKAREWDKKQIHLDRAMAIAVKMREKINFSNRLTAMELGAGTGLLSFQLRDSLSSVTLVDNSEEMIRICNEKIADTKATHFKALKLDLEHETLAGSFDLIYSQMVFHHISDVPKMLGKLNGMLNDDGIIAIADLYPEDGTFHSGPFDGHKGFDPEKFSVIMKQAGFQNISYETVFVEQKINEEGSEKSFPVFLIIAHKN